MYFGSALLATKKSLKNKMRNSPNCLKTRGKRKLLMIRQKRILKKMKHLKKSQPLLILVTKILKRITKKVSMNTPKMFQYANSLSKIVVNMD